MKYEHVFQRHCHYHGLIYFICSLKNKRNDKKKRVVQHVLHIQRKWADTFYIVVAISRKKVLIFFSSLSALRRMCVLDGLRMANEDHHDYNKLRLLMKTKFHVGLKNFMDSILNEANHNEISHKYSKCSWTIFAMERYETTVATGYTIKRNKCSAIRNQKSGGKNQHKSYYFWTSDRKHCKKL